LPKLEPLIYNQSRRLRNCWQPPLQIRSVYDRQNVCGHFSGSVRTNWLALSANSPPAARRALLAPAVLRGVGANRCGSAGPRPASPHVPLVRTNPQHPRAPSPRGAPAHSQANVQVNGRCDLKHKRDADLACWRAISVQNRCRGALRCGEGKRRAPPGHAGHRPTARVNGALRRRGLAQALRVNGSLAARRRGLRFKHGRHHLLGKSAKTFDRLLATTIDQHLANPRRL